MTQAPDIQTLSGQSMNLTEHNIEHLKQLFPNVFTEDKIDFEALKSELGEFTDTDNERYQFNWNGKEQAKRIATTPTLGTLRPAPEESVNWDTTENIYIEGDNLEALKLLQKSYFGKIKMIYIDPPYNTGKDFVYKDDFKDNLANYQRLTGQKDEEGNPLTTNTDSSGRYHSNWLNMMYPRLKLARNLLKDDGVIFMSIDDNEVHNLRKVCDEIFGETNFEGHIHWRRRHNQPNDKNKLIGLVAEHILCYTKSSSKYKETGVGKVGLTATFNNPDNDPQGNWASKPWKTGSGQSGSKYTITTPTGKELIEDWMGSEETFNTHLEQGRIYFPDNGNGAPRKKYYEFERQNEGQCATNWWSHELFGSNQDGSSLLESLFNTESTFSNPKPIKLIESLIDLGYLNSKDIVLDFFAGSGSTAHAVMNKLKHLNFITVQLPEKINPEKAKGDKAKKIALNATAFLKSINKQLNLSELTMERIRRASQKIQEENPEKQLDLGFKVFKLDTSNIKKWQPNLDDLETDLLSAVDNIMPNRTSQDLLFEVLIKYGLPLTLPVEQINIHNNGQTHQAWNVANNALIACFEENLTLEAVQAIAALSTHKNPVLRVVFRDTSFQNDIIKTNAIQRLKQAGIEDILSI